MTRVRHTDTAGGNSPSENRPLVLHVIHELGIGGLENGLVNLINRGPATRYRHAIVCLTDFTEFRERIEREDVPIIALRKRSGKDPGVYRRFWSVLREMRPQIVHTRNLAALEFNVAAALARVPCRVHGEHGRDIYDLDGTSFKYNLLRRAMRAFVSQYVAVSDDLAGWLVDTIGVRSDWVTTITNGVDAERFRPLLAGRSDLGPAGFAPRGTIVLGTVGRMQAVKDQVNFARAFVHLLETVPAGRERLRLVMVGDGPLRGEVEMILKAANAESLAWLPGELPNIPDVMHSLDVFVLPSLREGMSNTILEAMASALPVVATRVGGSPELVIEGETGELAPPDDPVSLAAAIRRYIDDDRRASEHGKAGRARVERSFTLEAMVDAYLDIYDKVLGRRGHRGAAASDRRPIATGLDADSTVVRRTRPSS